MAGFEAAVRAGNVHVVHRKLQRLGNGCPNHFDCGEFGTGSALHLACCLGKLPVVLLLCDHLGNMISSNTRVACLEVETKMSLAAVVEVPAGGGADHQWMTRAIQAAANAEPAVRKRLRQRQDELRELDMASDPVLQAEWLAVLAKLDWLVRRDHGEGAGEWRAGIRACGVALKRATTKGATAIMCAAAGGHTATVAALLNIGAYAGNAESSGLTALMLAARGGHTATVLLLLDHFSDESSCITESERATVRLRYRANMEVKSNSGWTALVFAVQGGRTTTAALLLDRGADSTALSTSLGSEGLTPLMLAARGGDTATTLMLLGCGLSVSATGTRGWTALMFAGRGGHAATAALLLDHSADPAATLDSGRTALDLVTSQGHVAAFGAALMARLDPAAGVHASAAAVLGDSTALPLRDDWTSAGKKGTDAQKLFAVAPGSSEHRAVAAKFKKTLPQLDVDSIQRVENGCALRGVRALLVRPFSVFA